MKKKLIIVFFLLGTLSCSFLFPKKGQISVMSWNLQNLFDDVDNGTEYSEFDPGRGSWDSALFRLKLLGLKQGVEVFSESYGLYEGPDILFVQEVENRNALEALSEVLGVYPYIVSSSTEGAIGLGILSRYPVLSVIEHQIPTNRGFFRPILEVIVLINEKEIHLFNNHWKSQSGGREETEELRCLSSLVLSERIAFLLAANPEVLIISAGDYNEDPDNYINMSGSTALSGTEESLDNPEALLFTYKVDDAGVKDGRPVLFSPWASSEGGTYYYQGSWNRLDNFFLSKGMVLLDTENAQLFYVGRIVPCITSSGFPNAFRSNSGCSDHLPILILLEV